MCTLKGSLGHLKFLTQLDLSGNNLRELPKLLARLEKLTALEHLNLQVGTAAGSGSRRIGVCGQCASVCRTLHVACSEDGGQPVGLIRLQEVWWTQGLPRTLFPSMSCTVMVAMKRIGTCTYSACTHAHTHTHPHAFC